MSAVHQSGKLEYHTIMKIITVITDIIILFGGRDDLIPAWTWIRY